MKPIEILVFGASWDNWKAFIKKTNKKNFKVTAVTRNIHRKGYILKSQANAGWIKIVEIETFSNNKLNEIFKNKDICINLIGILNEKNKFSFNNIHSVLPQKISRNFQKIIT